MPDDNRNSSDDKNSKRTGEFRVPPRTWVVWIAIFAVIVVLMLFKDRMEPQGDTISQPVFQSLVESNRIVQATINYNPQNSDLREVTGKYSKTEGDRKIEVLFRARVRLLPDLEKRLLGMPNVDVREPNTMRFSFMLSVLPISIIAALIWFFFIRQIKMAGKGA